MNRPRKDRRQMEIQFTPPDAPQAVPLTKADVIGNANRWAIQLLLASVGNGNTLGLPEGTVTKLNELYPVEPSLSHRKLAEALKEIGINVKDNPQLPIEIRIAILKYHELHKNPPFDAEQ